MIEAINLCKPLSYTSHVNRNVCFYGSHDSFCEFELFTGYVYRNSSIGKIPWGWYGCNSITLLTVPFLITIYMKSNHKQIYSLHLPAIKSILGGLLLYVGTFSLMLLISMALMKVFPESTKNLYQSFEGILKQPFFLVILVTRIMSAIGEELFFRGFLLGSLQNKYRMALSILISSVIFGVFHMSIVKLIPTAMFSPVEMQGMILVGIICLSMGICLFRLKRSENIIKKHSK